MQPFTTIGAIIFGLVALAHFPRLCLGSELPLNGRRIPLGGSILCTTGPTGWKIRSNG